MISADSDIESDPGQEAIAPGVLAYLSKPVRQAHLFDCLSRIFFGTVNGTEPAVTGGQTQEPGNDFASATFRSELILVAEDHPINQQVAQFYLSELGFTSHVVSNGVEAVMALAGQQYSLLLIDCQMPEMDGFEATRTIRQREAGTGHHIPIVAMTANALADDRLRCLEGGMDDYISKPIELERLRQVLENWLPVGFRQD